MPTPSSEQLAQARQVVQHIKEQRFAAADTILLCGSVVRGEATPRSDLDLVVLFDHVDAAWRESFVHDGWLIECFCHDRETAEYYFRESDYPSGIGALMHMVLDGIPVPAATPLSQQLKLQAQRVYDDGPPAWDTEETDNLRYTLSGLLDDLIGAQEADLSEAQRQAQQRAIASVVYHMLAQFYLRVRGHWGATGKTILRRLHAVDASLATQYEQAFADAFSTGNTRLLQALIQEILAPYGGYLFAGHRRVSGPDERRAPRPPQSR